MRDARRSGNPDPQDEDVIAQGARLGRELSDAVVMFHEAVGARHGLSAADHKALGVIRRHEPLTAGELARETHLTTGAVTGLVDRLTRAGLVRRRPDPADRRRILITTTSQPPGDALLADVFASLGRNSHALLTQFDEHQRAAVTTWIAATIDDLRTQTRRLR